MSIITISRGSYSRGKEIAEKVAQELGYECIARETLLEASEHFNIPEIKLVRAIHDGPSILHRFGITEDKYITYIESALLRHTKKDNVVYHGLAGHFLLKGISHVLKVRILSDIDQRVMLEMERENISRKEAQNILRKDDQMRRKWSKSLYGIDTADPCSYDMILHTKKITVNDAVDIICHVAGLKHFQATAESQKMIEDLWLASEVKAALIDIRQDIEVTADNGIVLVKTKAHISLEESLIKELVKNGQRVPGVKQIRVNVVPL
ncbi:cytidylate kinase family protein [Chloroflexota bacterium]